VEKQGYTTDGPCIDRVLADYSDGDIEALSDGSENENTQALAKDLIACTNLVGG
jgi:hypothetical protein